MLVAAQSWYKNFGSCGPIAEQFLPTYYAGGRKWQVLELEGEMISQDVQAVYHEPVMAIPAAEVTWGGTDTGDPHVPGGPQPERHPVLPTGVAVPWRLWVETAFPHAACSLSHWGFLSGKYSPGTLRSVGGIACRRRQASTLSRWIKEGG